MKRSTTAVLIACGMLTVPVPRLALAKHMDAVKKEQLREHQEQRKEEKAAVEDDADEEAQRSAARKAHRAAAAAARGKHANDDSDRDELDDLGD